MSRSDDEKEEAAFHEAGHAVVMVRCGFKVEKAEIVRNDVDARWDGRTYRTVAKEGFQIDLLDPTPMINECIIAFSGCLAQAKCVAGRSVENARFVPDQDWDSLLEWMKYKTPEVLLDHPLRFVDETSHSHIVLLKPRWFGGLDRSVFLKALSYAIHVDFHTRLIVELQNTMQYLDEANTWRAVEELAEALHLDGSVDGSRISTALMTSI